MKKMLEHSTFVYHYTYIRTKYNTYWLFEETIKKTKQNMEQSVQFMTLNIIIVHFYASSPPMNYYFITKSYWKWQHLHKTDDKCWSLHLPWISIIMKTWIYNVYEFWGDVLLQFICVQNCVNTTKNRKAGERVMFNMIS